MASADSLHRIANLLVILALVAMLIGAVVLVMAREETLVHVPAGEEALVLEHTARSWDPWGASLRVRVFGPANVTVIAHESTGEPEVEAEAEGVPAGFVLVWEERADAGETWQVRILNEGNATARGAVTVTTLGNHWVGGTLVVFGFFGFVFHRLGMRRSA
jgi:hypothetical protein